MPRKNATFAASTSLFDMTRLLFPALAALLLLGSACSTDFELEAPWKDIPIVYGFLDLQDTAHYIRLEKAFLQPGGNANQIAQIADSLYYPPSVTVQIEKRTTGQRFTLQRVDGNTEGYPRHSGPFATAPNYLYKIPASVLGLVAEQPVRLIINRGSGLPAVTADTRVLGPITPRVTSPANPLNLDYNRNLLFIWECSPSAIIFDIRMRIHYREVGPSGSENKTLEWAIKRDLQKAQPNADNVRFDDVKGEDFFRFVGANIEPAASRQRFLQGIDLVYTAGGAELRDLIQLERANTGITSSQAIPVYSNLSEGRGIFSSRSSVVRSGLTLNSPAMDSLRFGIYTRQLNFQ